MNATGPAPGRLTSADFQKEQLVQQRHTRKTRKESVHSAARRDENVSLCRGKEEREEKKEITVLANSVKTRTHHILLCIIPVHKARPPTTRYRPYPVPPATFARPRVTYMYILLLLLPLNNITHTHTRIL